MAIQLLSNLAYLGRTTGGFLDGGQDFTYCYWARYDAARPIDGATLHVIGANTGTSVYDTQYLWEGSSTGTTTLESYGTNDGSFAPGYFDYWTGSSVNPDLGVWYFIAVIYSATNGTVTVYFNNSSQDLTYSGVTTADFSANAFVAEYLGNDPGLSNPAQTVAYFRQWQAALTEAELGLEERSESAVRTADLFTDTPLLTISDLTDASGNAHDWTLTGTATTVDGPALPVPNTDMKVMQQIQNVMIETPDLGQTWDSGLWSKAEVVANLNNRQNQFLKDTQFEFGIALIDATEGDNVYDLPNDWITTIRVLWIDADGNTTELPRSDTWEADYGIPTWSYVEGSPKIFWDGGKPATLRIMPLPDEDGTLQIQYVPYSALLDGNGELMTLPDEFVPIIKYGALADMFSKVGRANDPVRAEYCAKRFRLGVDIARLLVRGFD